MGSNSETHYLRAIMPTLPTEIASKIRSICASPDNELPLENLVRFLSNAECASNASDNLREQWAAKQSATKAVLAGLNPIHTAMKRMRTDEDAGDSQQSKKQRISPPATNGTTAHDQGALIFTLHGISVTSPVRKRVDLIIYEHTIVLLSSQAVEASLPRSSLRRAFIVPTRGKSKPHWTVIVLSSDVPDTTKAKATPTFENQQLIFGLDANSTTALTTTLHSDEKPTIHGKNIPTLPHIQNFLSKLSIPVIQPSASVFKSACAGVGASAGTDGIPGVEAYRAAKAGNLWFSEEGILWGESKPCEFWAVGDLIGKNEGLRMVGSGRTFSVILTRRTMNLPGTDADMDVDGEDLGQETEFGMVDAREREGINEWVRAHKNFFGSNGRSPAAEQEESIPKLDKGKGKATAESSRLRSKPVNAGPMTIRTLQEDSDEEDEDFSAEISDLDGSEAMSGEESSSDEEGESGSDGEEGSEEGRSSKGPDDDEEPEEEDEEELDPAHHPLLRPGAVPRMSQAALEMAVGIVEDAFSGGGGGGARKHEEDDELEEEDELED